MEIQKLKKHLDNLKTHNLCLGFSELNFATSETLSEFQIGYSIDPDGNSLIGKKDGDWNENWIVISTDELAEPHFIDLKTDRIYTAMHGQGNWEPDLIAVSLDKYIEIINYLFELSEKRENAEDLDENPLTQEEVDNFEKLVTEINNNEVEFYEWESWTEND